MVSLICHHKRKIRRYLMQPIGPTQGLNASDNNSSVVFIALCLYNANIKVAIDTAQFFNGLPHEFISVHKDQHTSTTTGNQA
jgi:hypothetical protein